VVQDADVVVVDEDGDFGAALLDYARRAMPSSWVASTV